MTQSPTHPSGVRDAISDLIPRTVQEIVVSSAYISLDGSEMLMRMLRTSCPVTIDKVPKRIFAALDYGITTPEALAYWLDQPNTSVHVAGSTQLAAGTLIPNRAAFHPKIYAFKHSEHLGNLAVGSANLTGRGFTVNSEAVWVERDVAYVGVLAALDRLHTGLEPLTPTLLQKYTDFRKTLPPSPELRKEIERVDPPATPGPLNWFGSSTDSTVANPAEHNSMWIQAGTLSGGSHSQLELPRGAHRFFGFAFDKFSVHSNKVTIGTPSLRRGLRLWKDKILSWHGHNAMERINLPTRAQGGENYQNGIVLFRRLPTNNEFELLVAPWESDLARASRNASAQRGLLFRVGKNSDRQVGFL